jgi:group I intron endonuclease
MYIGYIYLFKNKVNNKCYIGKTVNLKRRYKEHLSGKYKSSIYNAIVKYGIDNFDFIVLDIIEKENITDLNNTLNSLETKRISEYNSYNNGYNLTIGGEGTNGACLSEETKYKQRISKVGDKNPCKSEIVKAKISKSLKEYYKDPNNKKQVSEETKQKISKSKLGDKNPMYGKSGVLNPSYGVNWTKNISEDKLKEFKKKRSNATKGDKNPMYGKSAMKGKKYPILLWIDENNIIHEMSIIGKKRHHPDWKPYIKNNNLYEINGDKATEN